MCPYIDIFGCQIGTYGLCLVLGFYLVATLAFFRGKPLGFRLEDLAIIAALAFGGAFFGGGILYAFVTYPVDQIIAFIKQGDLSFLVSGIVFYGGLIGGILGVLLGIHMTGSGLDTVVHCIVPFVPLGHAVGRIGCVMSGCCHGFAYDGMFALYYPKSLLGLSPEQGYFPVQPLESLVNIGICFVLLRLEKKMKHPTGLLFLYLGLYSVARFFLEMLRGDAIRGGWNGLSTSQYISITLLGVSLNGFLWTGRCARSRKG